MPEILIALVGLAGLLALTSLLPLLERWFGIPVTVLLAGFGILLALIVHLLADESTTAARLLAAANSLLPSPDNVLLLFLPLLLFEAALRVEVRRFVDDLPVILFLAVVAVFVGTGAVGMVLHTVTGAGLVACLLLSATIATTDPAAVASTLQDIGAPKRLRILVEGESLLNDAAAIAIFTFLLELLLRKAPVSIADGLLQLLTDFLGGSLSGYVAGCLLGKLVSTVRYHPLSVVTLTFSFAYLIFAAAEFYLQVSGVVAVVISALTLRSQTGIRISLQDWQRLLEIWSQLSLWAGTLVFIFAGMMMAPLLLDIRGDELLILLVVIVAALLARGLILFGLLPLLAAFGWARTIKPAHKLVMLWSGLRGGVSLLLVMAVANHELLPPETQRFIAVQATGFVLFTILIAGPTLGRLCSLLGLNRLSPVDRAIQLRALSLALTNICDRVKGMARSSGIEPEVIHATVHHYQERLMEIEHQLQSGAELSSDERIVTGLVILANREHELYLELWRDGIISREIAEVLFERTDWLLDQFKSKHGCRDGLWRSIDLPHRRPPRWSLFYRTRLTLRLQRWLRLAAPLSAYLSARCEALLITRAVVHELKDFNTQRLLPLLGSEVTQRLDDFQQYRLGLIGQALAAFKSRYGEYLPLLEQNYLSRVALQMEESEYALMYKESVISKEILNGLYACTELSWQGLRKPFQLGVRIPELLEKVELFARLEPNQLQKIAQLMRARLVVPGETFLRRGDRGGSMFFITDGQVTISSPEQDQPIRLGPGAHFGIDDLFSPKPRTIEAEAVGYCLLLELTAPDFRRLMEQDPALGYLVRARFET